MTGRARGKQTRTGQAFGDVRPRPRTSITLQLRRGRDYLPTHRAPGVSHRTWFDKTVTDGPARHSADSITSSHCCPDKTADRHVDFRVLSLALIRLWELCSQFELVAVLARRGEKVWKSKCNLKEIHQYGRLFLSKNIRFKSHSEDSSRAHGENDNHSTNWRLNQSTRTPQRFGLVNMSI